MQVKLSQIVESVESLKILLNTKLPAKTSYRIKRLVDKVNPILKSYDEKRNELIQELGAEQEDGNFAVTEPEALKVFTTKLNEILELDETVDFEPIRVEDLGEVSLAPKDIVEWIFVNE